MPRTPSAPVAPALIRWARQSFGLSLEEAAKKQRITTDRLAEWEAGEDAPTVAQLRAAARVYRRPLAVFFLNEPPDDFEAIKDFRRARLATKESWSPPLRLAIRRAHEQQDAAADLRHLLGEESRERVSVEDGSRSPKAVAAGARRILGVELDTQFSWRTEYQALNGWISALENEAHTLVLQAGEISTGEMRGFSIANGTNPVIVLNATDAVRGRIFTAIHEFAHILLNDAGLCDLHDRNGPSPDDQTELLCNEIAAAVLMPAEALLSEPTLARDEGEQRWTNAEIARLADKYSVSREALVRRLVSVRRAPWELYWSKRFEFERAYRSRTLDKKTFGVSYQRRRVRDYGRSYVRLVLDAYHEGRINTLDAADYLGGVNVRHLPTIELEAYRNAAAS